MVHGLRTDWRLSAGRHDPPHPQSAEALADYLRTGLTSKNGSRFYSALWVFIIAHSPNLPDLVQQQGHPVLPLVHCRYLLRQRMIWGYFPSSTFAIAGVGAS